MDNEEGPPQTRAAGLTRAILDTFPVVKFGRHNESMTTVANVNFMHDHEMKNWDGNALPPSIPTDHLHVQKRLDASSDDSHAAPTLVSASVDGSNENNTPESQPRETEAASADIDPAAIGTETCPICIVDFEEGDDLRVLPCDGKHRFHKDCVDPWLLELSSSCPICREGAIFK